VHRGMQVSGSGELLHDICSVNNNLSGVGFRYTAGVVQEPPSVGSSISGVGYLAIPE
jgi:hypothetical protein